MTKLRYLENIEHFAETTLSQNVSQTF